MDEADTVTIPRAKIQQVIEILESFKPSDLVAALESEGDEGLEKFGRAVAPISAARAKLFLLIE